MYNEEYEKLICAKEKQFNSFLNKTIILNAKDYYRMNKTKEDIELKILDDQNFEEDLSKYLRVPETLSFEDNALDFIEFINDVDLYEALKSLSKIEQMVIFLLFKKELDNKEISKMLNVYYKTVFKINDRALRKLRKYLKGDE